MPQEENEYREAVNAEMQRVYGISWQDASGNSEPLERGRAAGQSPVDLVDWWGRKYDLVGRAELDNRSIRSG